MNGAFYVGAVGLQAQQRALEMISSNIANVNTPAFKRSDVQFAEMMATRMNPDVASASPDVGSVSAGVAATASLAVNEAGDLETTGNAMDVAIQGTGFIELVGPGGQTQLWRGASAPQATTSVIFSDNLSSSATSDTVSGIAVYDTNGGQHTWQAAFSRTLSTDPWAVTVTDENGATVGSGSLTFTSGSLDPNAATIVGTDPTTGTQVTLDFSKGVTSYSAGTTSTIKVASADGYGSGTLTTLTVNAKGELEIGYSNDQKKQLGAIALAEFRDPSALDQQSGGLFLDKGQAGVTLLATGDPRVGKVEGQRLEASNVDLTAQFSDLILVQRGFQASSQIISVTNDMIQQLFGMRGQG